MPIVSKSLGSWARFGSLLPLVAVLAVAGCEKKEGLRITGIEPKVGPDTGGSMVTVSGSGFQAGGATGVKVYFGERAASRLFIEGDHTIKVEAPPGTAGQSVDLLFQFDDARSLSIPKAYTYEGFAPNAARDSLLKEEPKPATP